MQELEKLRHHGSYNGSFKPQFHAFGCVRAWGYSAPFSPPPFLIPPFEPNQNTQTRSYEGRAGLPSLFDSNYCYALGLTAGHLTGAFC